MVVSLTPILLINLLKLEATTTDKRNNWTFSMFNFTKNIKTLNGMKYIYLFKKNYAVYALFKAMFKQYTPDKICMHIKHNNCLGLADTTRARGRCYCVKAGQIYRMLSFNGELVCCSLSN